MNSKQPEKTLPHAMDDAAPQESLDSIMAAYNRFVPQQVFAMIGRDAITGVALGDHVEKTMSIIFSDIRNFTSLSEEMSPQENFAFINAYLGCMNPVIARHDGIIDKYIGDAIMALFPNGADDAMRCAIGMLEQLAAFNAARDAAGNAPIGIGAGVNTGLMMLGIVGGAHHMESTVISDAVNLASRIESMTKDYGVPLLISEHTYYALKDVSHYDTRFIDRVKVKGKAQCQSVYEVFDADPPELREQKRRTKDIFEDALAHYHLKKVPEAREMLLECLRHAPEDSAAQVYLARCEKFAATGVHESSGEMDLIIHWNAPLSVGHPVIDAQHHDLFEHINNFVEALGKSSDYSQLGEVIRFLDEYVAKHFEDEERCMAQNGYPFLQLQIDQHQRFSRYFEGFKKELERDFNTRRTFLLFRAQILIIDWLINHTAKLDGHFGKFLRQRSTPLQSE